MSQKSEPLRRRAPGEPAPWDSDYILWGLAEMPVTHDGSPRDRRKPSARVRAARAFALAQAGEMTLNAVADGAACSSYIAEKTLMALIAEGRMVRRRDPGDKSRCYLYRVVRK